MGILHPVLAAFSRGDADGYTGFHRRNPYPRGGRSIAYNDGFATGQHARRAEAVRA